MIWQDVIPRVNLALKITNWCNLCCVHCCERSHAKEPFNLMPIDTIEKYISQYKDMGIPVWDYVVFTGGESMAPYFCDQKEYIIKAAEICIKNGMMPTFKTNAKWTNARAAQILKDLSDVAHRHNHQVALDISIDEYHDNLAPAAAVVNQIMSSKYLSEALPVSFVGLNTAASKIKYQEFVNTLQNLGVFVGPMDKENGFLISKGTNLNVMFYDIGGLTRLGRAADNNIESACPAKGFANADGSDCLLLTNDDRAILNYKHRTDIKDKTVGQVYNELLQKKR